LSIEDKKNNSSMEECLRIIESLEDNLNEIIRILLILYQNNTTINDNQEKA